MISSNTSSLKVGRSKVSICSTLFWKVQCYGTRCPIWKRETEKKSKLLADSTIYIYIPAYKTFWKDVNGWSFVLMAVRHVACLSWSPGICRFYIPTDSPASRVCQHTNLGKQHPVTFFPLLGRLRGGKESRQWSVTSHPKGKDMYWFEWSNEIYEYPQKSEICIYI